MHAERPVTSRRWLPPWLLLALLPCRLAAEQTASGAPCQLATWTEGVQNLTVEVGTRARRYLLYTPQPREGETTLPLVLLGPGSDMLSKVALEVSNLAQLADMQRFSVAVLEGEGQNLNVVRHSRGDDTRPDDVAYVRAIVNDVATRACIDHRVFCAGYSRGGRFCARLASELPGLILAIATVGGVRYPQPNNATRPMPVIAIHGTFDPINPYNGNGSNDYWFEPVPHSIMKWAQFNGCTQQEEVTLSDHASMRKHTGCTDGADVILVTVADGGHTWPGTTFPFDTDILGPVNQEISASVLLMQFFKEHTGHARYSVERIPKGFMDLQVKTKKLFGDEDSGRRATWLGRGAPLRVLLGGFLLAMAALFAARSFSSSAEADAQGGLRGGLCPSDSLESPTE